MGVSANANKLFMTDKVVLEFRKRIQQIKLDFEEENPENRSRRLMDLKELSTAFITRQLYFPKISDLKEVIEKGEFIPIIPDYKLHDIFDLTPKKLQRQNSRFVYAYLVVGLSATIAAFFLKEYWLLASLPLAFISFSFISGQVGRIYILLAVIASVLLFVFDRQTLGTLIAIHGISIWCGQALRMHRRSVLLQLAFQDEEVFWFLYSVGVLSLFDPRLNRSIYKGCEKPTAEEYGESRMKAFNKEFMKIFNSKG